MWPKIFCHKNNKIKFKNNTIRRKIFHFGKKSGQVQNLVLKRQRSERFQIPDKAAGLTCSLAI